MGISKIEFGGHTLLDLTNDTVTADKLLSGATAHDKTGEIITGAYAVDATANAYDIYTGKTAYANGQKLTGAYQYLYPQLNSGSSGCSSSQLTVPCNFTPSGCCVVFNHSTYTNNRILSAWSNMTNIVYHTKTSSGVARTQITSGAENYIAYDTVNKQLVIHAASSSYLWDSNNYRVFVFR